MKKGISTVIAVVLMLTMTIALAGTSWMFISGVFTSKTSTAFSIVDAYGDMVTIRNDGTEYITKITAKLDGTNVNIAIVPNIAGLVAYWSMNEDGGTKASDSSGNGNDGTLSNGQTWATGKYGNALNFDGNDYVTNTIPSNLPTGNSATITAWIKPNSVQADSTYNGIVSYGPRACTGTSLMLSLQRNGRPSMATWCNDFVPISGPTVNWNQWNFVAVILNGQSVTLYVNDQSVSGTLESLPNRQSGVLNIGVTDNPGRYFNGIIDEVGIYNRALSESEIKQLYEGLIPAGQLATIEPLPTTSLSKGTHTLRFCTSSMCNTAYLTII